MVNGTYDSITPEKHETIVTLLAASRPISHIALVIDLPYHTVAKYCQRKGLRKPDEHTRRLTATVDITTRNRFRQEAHRRWTKPEPLVQRLLEIIARDDLFNALLEGEEFKKERGLANEES